MSKQALDNINQALAGQSELLMKQKLIQLGKNYWVMDSNQNTICNVRLNWGSNMMGNVLSSQLGKWAGRMMQYTYSVTDTNDQVALEIRKGAGSFKSFFNIVEPDSGENIGGIGLKRSLVGGMSAEWQDPQSGSTLITTKGNVIRRQYEMVDPSGSQIATVRHKIVAVRDVWQLQITGGTNHLHAVIFATVLDFEKEM